MDADIDMVTDTDMDADIDMVTDTDMDTDNGYRYRYQTIIDYGTVVTLGMFHPTLLPSCRHLPYAAYMNT
jgi:hypothetical protein